MSLLDEIEEEQKQIKSHEKIFIIDLPEGKKEEIKTNHTGIAKIENGYLSIEENGSIIRAFCPGHWHELKSEIVKKINSPE